MEAHLGNAQAPIQVKKWPTETVLFLMVFLASTTIWILLAVSIVGALYAVAIGAFLFFSQVAFITYLRGSAVKLGPDQFPELFRRVELLSNKAGLKKAPEAYILQADGSINAFATKFFRAKFIVLFTDLLDACEGNEDAENMIIGHELGHIKAGHLRWMWYLVPGMFVPFLGSAYSRAREFTCDRYGAALCGSDSGAKKGLSILAVGGKRSGKLNLAAYMKQQDDLHTGLMTLGKWWSTYPPLSQRLSAVDATAGKLTTTSFFGFIRAMVILILLVAIPVAGFVIFASDLKDYFSNVASEESLSEMEETEYSVEDIQEFTKQIDKDLLYLQELVEKHREETGSLPSPEAGNLTALWQAVHPDTEEPLDPYDGEPYSYTHRDKKYYIWTMGPDLQTGTADDRYAEGDL